MVQHAAEAGRSHEARGVHGEDGQDGEDDDGDEEGDEDASDDVSVAETEVAEQPAISDDDSEGSGDEGAAPGSPTRATHGGGSAKRQHVSMDVSPALAAELDAFDAHRAAPLNHSRKGVAVAPETRSRDRKCVLRFLGWLNANFKLKAPPTLTVFANPQVGAASQKYIKDLVEKHGRKYSYVANIAASLLAVARFVTVRRGGSPDSSVVAELSALHLQCCQQARKQKKFDLAEKPAAWLDWDEVQRVRVAAEM